MASDTGSRVPRRVSSSEGLRGAENPPVPDETRRRGRYRCALGAMGSGGADTGGSAGTRSRKGAGREAVRTTGGIRHGGPRRARGIRRRHRGCRSIGDRLRCRARRRRFSRQHAHHHVSLSSWARSFAADQSALFQPRRLCRSSRSLLGPESRREVALGKSPRRDRQESGRGDRLLRNCAWMPHTIAVDRGEAPSVRRRNASGRRDRADDHGRPRQVTPATGLRAG